MLSNKVSVQEAFLKTNVIKLKKSYLISIEFSQIWC